MNVYYAADLDERTFEGRTRTVLLLKEYLAKQGITFVDTIDEADLIHIHSSGVADAWKAASWNRKYGKPIIYSLYSLCETEPISHFTNHLQQQYYLGKRKTSFGLSYSAIVPLSWRMFPLQKIDAIIVPTQYSRKKLFANTEVIHIGVDTEKFKPLPPNKKSDAIKVGYFGHPSVYKGLIDFAKASALFPESVESHAFLSKTNEKIEKSLQKINQNLILTGFVKDIVKAYNEMDIIVAPHRSKLGSIANPLVILEAMACGKAVITTNFSFIKEIVNDSAVLVRPKSPAEIAAAVGKLLDSNIRKELGNKARARIVEEFDLQKTFKQYYTLYKKCENKN